MQKYLNPRNDTAFKRLFGTEKNKNILISLLNEVLKNQLHRSIIEVKFLPPAQEPEILSKKQSIVDVLCRDEDGCQYIIEMQVANTAGFEERAQYYASKAFVNQLNKGSEYKCLKEVIFLAFTNFSIFPEKKEYKSEHITLDKKTLENNLDKISFTFIDLVKFDQLRSKNIESLNLEEKFYYFLRHAEETTPEELKKLIGNDKVLTQAYTELNKVYWTEEELIKYESDEKAQRDNKAAMDLAKEEGIEIGEKRGIEIGEKKGMKIGEKKGRQEGIEIGEKKGRQEETEKLILNMRKNGASIEFIQKTTGLLEKDIQNILKEMEEKA